MMSVLAALFLAIAGLCFLYAALTDFLSWKIHNHTVIALIVLFVLYVATTAAAGTAPDNMLLPVSWPSALGAGALLFLTGFLLWQFKLLGAGDAKLMFPVGLFVGWSNLMAYAIFLIGFALLATLLLRLPLPYGLGNTWPGMRLNEIRKTGKVPYGVIMVAALFALLSVNYK